jgi:hypothetical protein
MAGGIFPNYPFELNIKCVIFSAIIIGLFFYCPPDMNIFWKIFISFVLFVIAYVALAWYDYKFDAVATTPYWFGSVHYEKEQQSENESLYDDTSE